MHETMRAAVIDGPGEPGVFRVADLAVPDRVSAEFLVKVVAAGVNPIDAKTRAGRGVFGAIRQLPERPRPGLQRRRRAVALRGAPDQTGRRGVRHGHGSAVRRRVCRIRHGPEHQRRAQAEHALAHRGGGRTGRRADRLGHGRRGREGARRAADAHPRRQRRRRSFRGAVRLVLRRVRDRDVVGTQPGLAARARRLRSRRLREHALRGRRVGGGCRHRPGRQRRTTTPGRAR